MGSGNFAPMLISIHAPAKGATSDVLGPCAISPISIHAPAKGATQHVAKDLVLVGISIHAPAKGATAQSCTVYG